ncbi:hypothetical protein M4J08_003875 [Streptomyces parvulus]|uniref:hypothetical protein n=1 Tax=Streptomyces parvulus TaxID=146923 RepID=UPI002108C7F3|nr:hypothetical protein [Streptomyces parvulus]MCQ4198269.1 hypothetical protein [Streptomyces parvulus]
MTVDVRVSTTVPSQALFLVTHSRAAPSTWRDGARRLLRAPGVCSGLEEAVHSVDLRPGVLALARVHVADAPDRMFTARAEHWMRVARTTWQESAAFCADVAWQARRDGRRLAEDVPHDGGDDMFSARTRLHLRGLALRYDFRRSSLEEVMRSHPGPWDVFSRALFTFALLGQSKPQGLRMMDDVLADAGDDVKVLHTLLHGLWLGEGLPRRHQHMRGILARPPFRGRTDAVALFREAAVLRETRRFGEALAAVDRAMEFLPPGDPGVHDDLVRERALTLLARDAYEMAGGAVPHRRTDEVPVTADPEGSDGAYQGSSHSKEPPGQ